MCPILLVVFFAEQKFDWACRAVFMYTETSEGQTLIESSLQAFISGDAVCLLIPLSLPQYIQSLNMYSDT